MNSSNFEIQISNSNRHVLCQLPSFIFTKKKMKDVLDKGKVSRSIIIFMPWLIIWRVEDYMIKGQNCSDMTPHVPAPTCSF